MTVTNDVRLIEVTAFDDAVTASDMSSGNSTNDWLPCPYRYDSFTVSDDDGDEADREQANWADLAADAFSQWAEENPF